MVVIKIGRKTCQLNEEKIIPALKQNLCSCEIRKSEKFQACWDKNPDLCDTGAVLK